MNRIVKNTNSSKFFWNTVGSMCNAGTSFLLLIFVTRICGSFQAGIFALGFANAQLMLTIGRYGMRAYQATDVRSSVKFSTYFISRIITCALMLIISFTYIVGNGYSLLKSIIVFSICIIKTADAAEDVFHGLFQQNGRMELAGKLLTIRNLITILSFLSVLIITRNLMASCIITGVLSLIVSICLNIPNSRQLIKFKLEFNRGELLALFIHCSPLFLGSFLSLYIYNVPKYAIDRYLSSDIQTFFNILFMPAFVINLFSEFIFKPLLTDIAKKWLGNQIKDFNHYILKLFTGVGIISAAVVIAGSLAGNKLLSWIYGVNLNPYQLELFLLLCSGAFGAGVYLLFHILTAMRQQVNLLVGYILTALIITIFTPVLVHRYQMMGAVLSCLISSAFLFIVFMVMLLLSIWTKHRQNYS